MPAKIDSQVIRVDFWMHATSRFKVTIKTEDKVGMEWLVPAKAEVKTKVNGTLVMRANTYRFMGPYLRAMSVSFLPIGR